MTKRTEDWIKFETPEGKAMLGAPSHINKMLGVDKIKDEMWRLRNRVSILERNVIHLERPHRQERVLVLLFDEEKPRSFVWLRNRIANLSYLDIDPLVSGLKLFLSKAGSTTMYSLNTHEKRST